MSDYETPYMPEDVRQDLRQLYMGRIDTYPYFYYPVRMRKGYDDEDKPMIPLPPDLMDPNERKFISWSLKFKNTCIDMKKKWQKVLKDLEFLAICGWFVKVHLDQMCVN